MMKFLERTVASVDQRLLILAPPDTAVPESFINYDFDADRHADLLREIQRFRGRIYCEDGALEPHQLSPDGRHQTPEDERSWHLVLMDAQDRISAVAWYKQHDSRIYFNRLRIRHCPLAMSPEWRDTLWKAVESEIIKARQEGLSYAEVGGWAVANDHRGTPEAIVLALAAYSLGQLMGGALSITTATARHGSSSILSRLGGRPLQVEGTVLPPYYDPSYRCTMEILRFDSRTPSARFVRLVEQLQDRLPEVAVVARPYWPAPVRQRPAAWTPAAVAVPTISTISKMPEMSDAADVEAVA